MCGGSGWNNWIHSSNWTTWESDSWHTRVRAFPVKYSHSCLRSLFLSAVCPQPFPALVESSIIISHIRSHDLVWWLVQTRHVDDDGVNRRINWLLVVLFCPFLTVQWHINMRWTWRGALIGIHFIEGRRAGSSSGWDRDKEEGKSPRDAANLKMNRNNNQPQHLFNLHSERSMTILFLSN